MAKYQVDPRESCTTFVTKTYIVEAESEDDTRYRVYSKTIRKNMKFKTFENLLNNCKRLHEISMDRDRQLSDVLGGDSEVITDWYSEFIEETLNSISLEFNVTEDTLDWLFWDSMCSDGPYHDWEQDDVIYEGSPANIWMDLSGILDERFAKSTTGKVSLGQQTFNFDDNTHFVKKEDTLRTLKCGIRITQEAFIDVNRMFGIDLDELESNKSYSLINKKGICYTIKLSETQFNITKNPITKEAKEDLGTVKQVFNDNEEITSREGEFFTVVDTGVEERTLELEQVERDNYSHKLIILKDKQIQLESIELSEALNAAVSDALADKTVSIGGFIIDLDTTYKAIKLKAKYKDDITKMSGSFRMVLINLIGSSMTQSDFEVKKVLHNLKEQNKIIQYQVSINDNNIEGSVIWEDINETPTYFNIEMTDEVIVEFK